jgi:hypothetical protein
MLAMKDCIAHSTSEQMYISPLVVIMHMLLSGAAACLLSSHAADFMVKLAPIDT